MSDATRIIVYGAGSVGGVIGGRLVQHQKSHGCEVVCISRGEHLEAMRRHGLTINDPDASVTVDVAAVGHPSEIEWRSGDVVVLAMKTQHTESALADLETAAALAAPDLAIVCAQNGVENERRAARRFRKVYAMCVMMPATLLAPGVVEVSFTPFSGILDLGRYPEGVDDTASAIAKALEASNIASRVEPDIMAIKYNKLLLNLGNALEAATGGRRSRLLKDASDEAEACFRAAGIRWTDDKRGAERRSIITIKPVGGKERGGGSTWQSLARGTGNVEVDYLNGEISLLGRLHSIPTPVNDMLRRVANRMARNHEAPGSLTEADLRAELSATSG